MASQARGLVYESVSLKSELLVAGFTILVLDDEI